MTQKTLTHPADSENVALGISFAIIQVSVFFSFIFYCAFHTSVSPFTPDKDIPTPFMFGLLVIVCGTALTALYVLITNRQDDSHV